IAELAGVSRSPVREALRILARDGLVEILPRLGAQVAAIGVDDARGLYACRMLLEPKCARLAVAALTPSDVVELDAIRAAMEGAVEHEDPRQFLDDNIAYFRILAGQRPNRTLREPATRSW